MGFDDIIFDTNLENTILKQFGDNPSLLTTYSENPTIKKLIEWEENNRYCGYSLAYHLLYSIRITCMIGARSRKVSDEDIEWVKLGCREKICEMIHKYYEGKKDEPSYRLCEQAHDFYLEELIKCMERKEEIKK